MIFTYTPRDGAPRRWDLAEVRFLSSEAETVERTTSLEWGELLFWRTLVMKASPTARRALLWVLLKRDEPTLRYSACDPVLSDIDVKLGAGDLAEFRAEAAAKLAAGELTEAEFEEGIRDLESITDPESLAAATPEAGPKAAEQPVAEAAPTAWAPTASPTGEPSGAGLLSTVSA